MKRAKAVSFLLLDVDGVLTDGRITFTADGTELKSFHIQDGFGLKQLQAAGIGVGLLSGRTSPIVDRRAKELDIIEVHQGVGDKLRVYERLVARLRLADREVAYVGDDVPDLPVLQRVGLAVSVHDAHPAIRRAVHYVTSRCGGAGAVREVCDLLRQAKGVR